MAIHDKLIDVENLIKLIRKFKIYEKVEEEKLRREIDENTCK